MDKEKQINEIIKIIARRSMAFRNPNVAFMTTARKTADSIYNAGYRNTSDVADEIVEQIDDFRAIADFYHREAEKNLRLPNEGRGVVWHSVAYELPSENGTYLVVGRSGKEFITHFYKERKLITLGYYTIPEHFGNSHVRFLAKLPDSPIHGQDYQTLIINNKNLRILLDRIEMVVDDIRVIAEKH